MHTEETKKKISLKHRGKILTTEHKEKLRQAKLENPVRYWKGKKLHPNTIEARKKVRAHPPWKGKSRPNLTGENHWNWKGGISPENNKIRGSVEYKIWRRAVFERDGYQCVWGGKAHGNKLNADHIKPFASYPELRFAIDNGRTLCVACHKTLGTYAGKRKN